MKSAPIRMTAARACGLAALLSLASSASAAPAPPSLQGSSREPSDADVRRFEYVVLVRVNAESPQAIGFAESAAFSAGGAVLETMLADSQEQVQDYRLLVRTRSQAVLGEVIKAMRRQPGVVGAAAVQLPETETWAGSPSFLSAYDADVAGDVKHDGVLVRQDVPPVVDKRDILETSSVPLGPSLAPEQVGLGGLTLNISALIKRLKARSWARREQRMKDVDLPILPPGDAGHD